MRDLRPAVLVIGVLLIGLGVAMLAPMIADILAESPDWRSFAGAGALCAFFGGCMSIAARGPVETLSIRSAFLMTTLSWVVLAAFAAIPFLASRIGLSVGDAFFEAMSGLTTTGATVITVLDTKPPGLLLWRAILQWIGGVGIVVTAIAILPLLQVGGMQLFRLESSDASDKVLPRAGEIAGLIGIIYIALTLLCAVTYRALGMPAFEAIAHAMTTISTGGFSTSDGSMGTFMRHGADFAATFFMIAAALPFSIYMLATRGRLMASLRDSQARAFLAITGTLILVMTVYLVVSGRHGEGDALRLAAFNVVSVLTGTGYATTDYGDWGPFAVAAFFCMMFLGGCAGSTSCGIKVFRIQVAVTALRAFLDEMMRPHHVAPMRYNQRPLPQTAVYSVLSFLFLFFGGFTVCALSLALLGVEPTTALSAAAASISNVGPGLGGMVGPAGNYLGLPEEAKWILSITMLAGRLEILSVLVLFTPTFWRS
ncbi:MAG: TrkH family potassium uptake protein [Maricaulaceae bacterium]|jgi:trk system potassium uptake protein TrkH